MVIDPKTLVVTAVLPMTLIGILMATLTRDTGRSSAKRWWVSGFLLNSLSYGILAFHPEASISIRTFCNMIFFVSFASCYNGARATAGRPTSAWPVLAAFSVWPLFVSIFDAGFSGGVTGFSIIICAMSALTAVEFARGASPSERSRRVGAVICILHFLFYLARAVMGPAFGTSVSHMENAVSSWAAIIALEGILFASALAILAISASLERERLTERRKASTDFLTSIGNRRAFDSAIRPMTEGDDDRQGTLLLLDLDNFKQLNDQRGHQVGDAYLVAFTAAVRGLLPDPDLFWRLGGDEFAILLTGTAIDRADAITAALRIMTRTSSALARITAGIEVSVSIGSAQVNRGETLFQLLRRSDYAMYLEKNERLAAYRGR